MSQSPPEQPAQNSDIYQSHIEALNTDNLITTDQLARLKQDFENHIFNNKQISELTEKLKAYEEIKRGHLMHNKIEGMLTILSSRFEELDNKNKGTIEKYGSSFGELAGKAADTGLEYVVGGSKKTAQNFMDYYRNEVEYGKKHPPRGVLGWVGIAATAYALVAIAKKIVDWGNTSSGFFRKAAGWTGLFVAAGYIVNHMGSKARAEMAAREAKKGSPKDQKAEKGDEKKRPVAQAKQQPGPKSQPKLKQKVASTEDNELNQLSGTNLLEHSELIKIGGHSVRVERIPAMVGSNLRFTVGTDKFDLGWADSTAAESFIPGEREIDNKKVRGVNVATTFGDGFITLTEFKNIINALSKGEVSVSYSFYNSKDEVVKSSMNFTKV